MKKAIGVGISVVVVDQVSKKIAELNGLTVLNKGISFGVLPLDHPFFSFMIILGCGLLVVGLLRQEWLKYPVSAGLFIGGAASNLCDRLLAGGVKDWLSVGPFPLKNNLADWAIFLAVVIVLISLAQEEFAAKMLRKSSRRVQ